MTECLSFHRHHAYDTCIFAWVCTDISSQEFLDEKVNYTFRLLAANEADVNLSSTNKM